MGCILCVLFQLGYYVYLYLKQYVCFYRFETPQILLKKIKKLKKTLTVTKLRSLLQKSS